MMNDVLVRRAYAFDKSEVYSKYSLINTNYLESIEEELINKQEYIPVLVRRYLTTDYISYLKTNAINNDKLMEILINSRNYSHEQEVEELLSWIKQHNNYSQLFNKTNYKNLQKELNKLQKEYNGIDLW